MSAWALPGFEVEELLGFGATGEVWRARERATGEAVALKRLRAGADAAALGALHREAALLRSLDTPYVVRQRAVIDDVLVLDHAAGGSLAALLVRRLRRATTPSSAASPPSSRPSAAGASTRSACCASSSPPPTANCCACAEQHPTDTRPQPTDTIGHHPTESSNDPGQ